jgi:hypothetical protein
MPQPYIQKTPWLPFIYNGESYDLSHLNEHEIQVLDSKNVERKIAVTYEDHCFTDKSDPNDDPNLYYPNSSRDRACFSLDRYHHSLSLPLHIATIGNTKVWYAEGDNYALIPTIDHNGQKVLYAIFFSLSPLKGLPVSLHLRILSAHLADRKIPTTYGFIDFSRLVTLKIQRIPPKRNTDRARKRPKIQ